jgi:hypothetical protein
MAAVANVIPISMISQLIEPPDHDLDACCAPVLDLDRAGRRTTQPRRAERAVR